jgi:hypothetical protein
MKKWLISTLIMVLAIVVLIFRGNDEQDLGNDYYYLPEYEAIDIGFPNGAVIYKAKQKNVFTDIKLQGNIVDVSSNPDFIIAAQKTDSSNLDNYSLQYYIIVKREDSIYGPFNKEEYSHKREKLNIPKKLTLKE